MSLYLGKIGRKIVQHSATSPTMRKAVNVAGNVMSVLSCGNYKVGLTRAAFQLSQIFKPKDIIEFQSGKIIKDGMTIFKDERLLKGVNIDRVEITENMSTPEGMAAYLRWGVFYDKKKVVGFFGLFASVLTANVLLNNHLTHVFQSNNPADLYHSIIGGLDSAFKVEFRPMFHALHDDSSSFVTAFLPKMAAHSKATLATCLVIFSGAIINCVAEFRNDRLIKNKAWNFYLKISNYAAALTLSGVTTSLFYLASNQGAWDYIYIKLPGCAINCNTSDLLLLAWPFIFTRVLPAPKNNVERIQ